MFFAAVLGRKKPRSPLSLTCILRRTMVRGRVVGGSALVEVDECERKINLMVNVSGNRQQLSGAWNTNYTNYKRGPDYMPCSSTIVSMAIANNPTGVTKDEKSTRGCCCRRSLSLCSALVIVLLFAGDTSHRRRMQKHTAVLYCAFAVFWAELLFPWLGDVIWPGVYHRKFRSL